MSRSGLAVTRTTRTQLPNPRRVIAKLFLPGEEIVPGGDSRAALQGVLPQMKAAHSGEPLIEAQRTLVPMVASYVGALASGDFPEAPAQ